MGIETARKVSQGVMSGSLIANRRHGFYRVTTTSRLALLGYYCCWYSSFTAL
ncbi:hypothetical protein B0H67DRAFT_592378 [Lasiosphaeris hirsuta]|uniref:Uncharacterized protein n=1 Tax=Lasiosphaeris hirsuta TaxID=260670 RepID=A0AA39ZW63_9PEZI|nr:hypothetical protein B0H67DRAFT_592378 [Lasiosphaeris hirsuta]